MIREHDFLSVAFFLRSKSENRREQSELIDVREIEFAECFNDIKKFHNSIKEDFSTKCSIINYVKKSKRRRRRIEEPIKRSEMKIIFSKSNALICFPILYMTEIRWSLQKTTLPFFNLQVNELTFLNASFDRFQSFVLQDHRFQSSNQKNSALIIISRSLKMWKINSCLTKKASSRMNILQMIENQLSKTYLIKTEWVLKKEI